MKSPKFNFPLFTLIAMVTIIVFNSYSRAEVIFNDFGPGDTYQTNIGWTVGGGGRSEVQVWPDGNYISAMPFEGSGNNYTLDSIKLAIGNAIAFPPSNNHVDVSVMSNNGGTPGFVIEMFHFTNAMGEFGQYYLPVVGNSVLHPLLQQNTTYWLSASAGNDTWAAWNFNSIGQLGQAQRKDNGGWGYWSSEPTGAFSVNGTPVPGTSILTASLISSVPGLLRIPQSTEPGGRQELYDRLINCSSDPTCDYDKAVDDLQTFDLNAIKATQQVAKDAIPLVTDPQPIPTSSLGLLTKLITKAKLIIEGFKDLLDLILKDPESSPIGDISLEGTICVFRGIPDTHSGAIRTPIPFDSGQSFQSIADSL